MGEFAADFVSGVEGELRNLALGISTDVHLRNVHAHVQNGLYHAERTPEIDAAAGRLLTLAQEFSQRYNGMIVGQQAKDARDQHIERMREAFHRLRDLLRTAQPSAVSRALGG